MIDNDRSRAALLALLTGMDEETAGSARREHRSVARLEAFSDGVFAFAITLLVISIRIPRPDDPDASAGVQQLILQQWPSYVAFALTFIVVGTVWANTSSPSATSRKQITSCCP